MLASPRGDRAPRRHPESPEGDVTLTRDGATATLIVTGHLDVVVGETLVSAARSALDEAPARIDIDLQGVASFTSDGASALGSCRDLGVDLADGLHYRTGQGPGMAALLEGCSDVLEPITDPTTDLLP